MQVFRYTEDNLRAITNRRNSLAVEYSTSPPSHYRGETATPYLFATIVDGPGNATLRIPLNGPDVMADFAVPELVDGAPNPAYAPARARLRRAVFERVESTIAMATLARETIQGLEPLLRNQTPENRRQIGEALVRLRQISARGLSVPTFEAAQRP